MRKYINTIQGGNLRSHSSLPIYNTIREINNLKGLCLTCMLISLNCMGRTHHLQDLNGKKDLECNFEQDTWEHICESASSFSFNSRHRLMQFNITHRVYYTPERLHKISISYSECCTRCKTEVGTLLHMFWSCSELETYWRNIIQTIDKLFNVRLPFDPRFMLLGDESILQLHQRKNSHLVKMALIAAKKCVYIQWKSEFPPSRILWLRELSSYMPVEKIMFNLKKSHQCLKGVGADLLHT